MRRLLSVAAAAACSHSQPPATPAPPPKPLVGTARVLPLLPDGAQLIVEIDLGRLRANTMVGEVATRWLAQLGGDSHVPGLPISVAGSPLADADAIVHAAYGVGTEHAATITVLSTKAELAGTTRLAPDLVALGPDDWVGQVATPAGIAATTPLVASSELLRLRDHAVPAGATGAVVRVTARLPFDARVAIARETGLDLAPAQLSLR